MVDIRLVRYTDGILQTCSVNGERLEAHTSKGLNIGDVISFGGAAEVGQRGQSAPNPFLYVVAQHPPVQAQANSSGVGSPIDLTSPDHPERPENHLPESNVEVPCSSLMQCSWCCLAIKPAKQLGSLRWSAVLVTTCIADDRAPAECQ